MGDVNFYEYGMNASLRAGIYLVTLSLFVLALAYEYGMVLAGVAPAFRTEVVAPALAAAGVLPLATGAILIGAGTIDLVRRKESVVTRAADKLTIANVVVMLVVFLVFAGNVYVVG